MGRIMRPDRLGDSVEWNLELGGARTVGAGAAGRREEDRGLAGTAGSGSRVSYLPGGWGAAAGSLPAAALGTRMRVIAGRFARRPLIKGGGAK